MQAIDTEKEKSNLIDYIHTDYDSVIDYKEEVFECYDILLNQFKPNGKEGMYYKEIAEKLGLLYEDELDTIFEVNERNALAHMLGVISSFEVSKGRPMLSAIVVRHDTDRPGKGFYRLAQNLSQMKEDESEEKFWIRTCKELKEVWKN